ncbi:MAG: asparaginase [Actinomycetota bacterium]
MTRFEPGSFAPIAVARRSGFDESLHHGAAAVVDADGRVVAALGDPALAVYLRSSLKAFQATAMVELGLDVADPLLALVAASHSGEARHLDGVRRLLDEHGLSVDDLGNTPTLPYGAVARAESIRAGAAPSSLFQNCSGKHAGMLATCRVNDWTVDDYLATDHPLQWAITEMIEALGATVHQVGVDGCGAPTHALGLADAARALGRLAQADSPVLRAMQAHPDMVGGDRRDVTAWMRAVPGLAAKDGAAGVMALTMVRGERRGWSAVFKIADGSDAARRAVIPAALAAMGVDVEAVSAAAARDGDVVAEVLGGGRPVGYIDPLPWT